MAPWEPSLLTTFPHIAPQLQVQPLAQGKLLAQAQLLIEWSMNAFHVFMGGTQECCYKCGNGVTSGRLRRTMGRLGYRGRGQCPGQRHRVTVARYPSSRNLIRSAGFFAIPGRVPCHLGSPSAAVPGVSGLSPGLQVSH